MPRAAGSRTGRKHLKRKKQLLAAEEKASQQPRLAALEAAVAAAEVGLQSQQREEHAALFSLLDVQLQAVEDDEHPRRPVSRVGVCPHCGSVSGNYVRTCEDPVCQRARHGWSVMVVSESMAVTCVLKCDGHRRIWCSNVRTGFCRTERCPDITVDRAM